MKMKYKLKEGVEVTADDAGIIYFNGRSSMYTTQDLFELIPITFDDIEVGTVFTWGTRIENHLKVGLGTSFNLLNGLTQGWQPNNPGSLTVLGKLNEKGELVK